MRLLCEHELKKREGESEQVEWKMLNFKTTAVGIHLTVSSHTCLFVRVSQSSDLCSHLFARCVLYFSLLVGNFLMLGSVSGWLLTLLN